MTADLYTQGNRYHVMLSWYENDVRKQKSKTTGIKVAGNNKRKAEEARKQILKEWEQAVSENRTDILFSDYMKQWLEDIRYTLAESTYHSYKETIYNVICPYFEERRIKLHDLTHKHIQDFYTYKQNGSETRKGVSPNTIHHYHANLRKALNDAYIINDLIPSNPAVKVILPRVVEFKCNPYSQAEIKSLADSVIGTRLEVPVLLASWFGMSRGEILGIKWQAISFEEKTLRVFGTVTNKGSGKPSENEVYRHHEAKRSKRLRSFPLSDKQVRYLQALKQKQIENRLLCGDSYNTEYTDFVCVDDVGDKIRLNYVTKAFSDMFSKLGLRKIRFHDLRHTNISLLLEAGIPLKELQDWAGHANLSTTADIYAHIQANTKMRLTDTMSNILSVSC
jgi:integrase